MNLITQAKNAYAFKLPAGGSFPPIGAKKPTRDVLVSDGGFLLAEFGGKNIELINVGSKGRVHGTGQYFVGVFNKHVDSLRWVNTGMSDKWVVSSTGTKPGEMPGEAAFRINGHVGRVQVVGVNFRCGTWIDKDGRKDWWKQVVQIRNADDAEFTDCKIIGPHELGAIDKGQIVKQMRYVNCGLTHMPKFTKDRASVKSVVFKGCYWIDENGKPTGKKIGNQEW